MSLIPKISKRVDWFIGHAGFFWRHDPLYLLGLDIGWHRQCQYGEVMKFGEHVFNDIINLFHDDFSWIFESPVTAFTKSQIPKKALMLNLVMYSASSRCVCVCVSFSPNQEVDFLEIWPSNQTSGVATNQCETWSTVWPRGFLFSPTLYEYDFVFFQFCLKVF